MPESAVLLLNLGSPKSCEVGDVRDYLREFLGDERVLDGSALKRFLLLHGVILRRRPAKSAAAYKKVWTPEGAPLLAITERLRAALETASGVRIYAAMRYGEPSCRQIVARMKKDGVRRVFVIPQYPHYAMSSYETAVVCAREAFSKQAPAIETVYMPPMYRDSGYIGALVESAKSYLEKPFDKLLFSYHGVPVRHLRKSDPTRMHCMVTGNCCSGESPAHATCYRYQCLETMRHFIAAAGVPAEKCAVSFQSRLGREEWLRPYTDETLRTLPAAGAKRLLVICPAFTADCLETLEEIAVEGRHAFLSAGGESFEQIPCLNDNPAYVRFLTEKITGNFNEKQ